MEESVGYRSAKWYLHVTYMYLTLLWTASCRTAHHFWETETRFCALVILDG